MCLGVTREREGVWSEGRVKEGGKIESLILPLFEIESLKQIRVRKQMIYNVLLQIYCLLE